MLLGWYLDEIVIFLIRTILRRIAERRSKAWPVVDATVLNVRCEEPLNPLVDVRDSYWINGDFYWGVAKRPFWFRDSAKHFAAGFTPGNHFAVHYHPQHPDESVVLAVRERPASIPVNPSAA